MKAKNIQSNGILMIVARNQLKSTLMNLKNQEKDKIVELFRLMGDEGEIKNIRKFRHEGDQIYAFKSSFDRFFCFFFDDSKVIVTNACEKKSDKMPPNEKAKALKFRSDYRKRCTVGKYYE